MEIGVFLTDPTGSPVEAKLKNFQLRIKIEMI